MNLLNALIDTAPVASPPSSEVEMESRSVLRDVIRSENATGKAMSHKSIFRFQVVSFVSAMAVMVVIIATFVAVSSTQSAKPAAAEVLQRLQKTAAKQPGTTSGVQFREVLRIDRTMINTKSGPQDVIEEQKLEKIWQLPDTSLARIVEINPLDNSVISDERFTGSELPFEVEDLSHYPLDPKSLRKAVLVHWDKTMDQLRTQIPEIEGIDSEDSDVSQDEVISFEIQNTLNNYAHGYVKVSPQVRAALIGLLATTPGLIVDDKDKDPIGRPAISITETYSEGGMTTRYTSYYDEKTSSLLAVKSMGPSGNDDGRDTENIMVYRRSKIVESLDDE